MARGSALQKRRDKAVVARGIITILRILFLYYYNINLYFINYN